MFLKIILMRIEFEDLIEINRLVNIKIGILEQGEKSLEVKEYYLVM